MVRRVACFLALALGAGGVLGACDGGDDGDESDDRREQTDGGSDNREDQELADEIVLTEDDVPEGFVEQEDEDDEDDDFSEDETIVDCVDPDLLEDLKAIEDGESGGSADSAYELDELVIGSGALVMPDEEQAREFFDLYLGDCFQDAFVASFSGEATDEAEVNVDLDPIEDLPDVGDAIEGFTVQATTSGFGVTLEFAVIQTGRAMAFILTAGVGESFPVTDRDAAIETVAERMESAA